MYVLDTVHLYSLSLSLSLCLFASVLPVRLEPERNLPYVRTYVRTFVSLLLVTQEAGRPNNARLYLLRDREIDRRFRRVK